MGASRRSDRRHPEECMADLNLDRHRTAVLVMDFQTGLVGHMPDLLDNAAKALESVRAADLPVFYIKVTFRDGYPEVSPRNRTFSGVKERGMLLDSDEQWQIHPKVAPHPDDVVVTKKRVGPFSSTDLDVILRGRDLTTLVLMGYATSGVVLSTVRWAADIDYDLIVVEDCCANGDEEVHRVLMEKVFPGQCRVIKSQESTHDDGTARNGR
jgi:nicotinamidase-related amidase